MKRKIFSKLLMVALVIAAVGSFVSCKDYDDDINNLQKQIDAKAALSELTALQSTLDSKIAAAQSAATAAQAKADAAATKTSVDELKKALETAIADAKKAGTDAGTKAGDAIAAANKAQETAEGAAQAAKDADAAAKAALADALKTIEETYQTKAEAADAAKEAADALAAVKTIAEAAYTKAQAEKLQEQVDNLKADLESSIEEKVKEAIKNVDNATASVAAIWTAATSVELCLNEMKWGNQLMLLTGKKVASKFGDESYSEAVETISYTAGEDIEFTNNVVVRVNPVNADLSTLVADGKVFLINSLKENLNDYVDFGTPTRYTELVTRAYENETGLWVIPVTLKKGVDQKALNKASHYNAKTATAAGYAVAINNTDSLSRYTVSAYDLKPVTGPYLHASRIDFTVNGERIATLKNRWNGAKYEAEDGTKSDAAVEYIWADSTQYKNTPATAIVIDTETAAATNPTNVTPAANGLGGEYVVLENYNDDIIIDNVAGIYRNAGNIATYVEWYYVTLDSIAAIESEPSEINAWRDANITGLYKRTSATEKTILNVNNEKAAGDIIGFRVYAVNYDGTLADPDGVAFYVKAGKEIEKANKTYAGTFPAKSLAFVHDAADIINETTDANGVVIPVDFTDLGLPKDVTVNGADLPANLTATYANNKAAIAGNITVNITYLKSDALDGNGNAQVAGPTELLKNVKFIAVSIADASQVIDGYTFTTNSSNIVNPDKHDEVVGKFALTLTKGALSPDVPAPYKLNPVTWKTGYAPVGGVVTLYPIAPAWNTAIAAATGVDVDLDDFVTNLDADINGATHTDALKVDGKKATAAQGSYAKATGVISPTAQYIGAKSLIDGKSHTYNLNLTTTNGVPAISRKYLEAAAKDDANDAAQLEGGAAQSPKYTVLSQNIKFGDIWDYQTYKVVSQAYTDGTPGQKLASVVTKKNNQLYLKYSELGTTQANAWYLHQYLITSAAASASDATLIGTAATIGLQAAKANGTLKDIMTILEGENSAISTFANGAFAYNNYVSYDEYKVITVENNHVDEFVKFADANTMDNFVAFYSVGGAAPTKNIPCKFQFTATDAFGLKHVIEVPFTLVP